MKWRAKSAAKLWCPSQNMQPHAQRTQRVVRISKERKVIAGARALILSRGLTGFDAAS